MRKILTFPLRLSIGWGMSPRLLGLIGATLLVMLRVTIGIHFYSEGIDKTSREWSATPFFSNARGPLASEYHKLVWDADGRFRLNIDSMKWWWAGYRDQVQNHYGFDEDQKRLAQANYAKAVERYEWVLSENAADIEEFKLGRDRIAVLYGQSIEGKETEEGKESEEERRRREKLLRDSVSSLGGQRETIRKEWLAKAASTLKQIDAISTNYQTEQNKLATTEQRASAAPLLMVRPRTNFVDTSVIDRIVPYFDLAIGICLMFGLFTPVASLAAAGFLGSVFLSQFPPAAGPGSTYYQLIECMACFVLAGTGAGRIAGLDYFLHLIVRRVWGPTAEAAST